MKTLRQLVAVALLLGSYHVGMAQSNSNPTFKSEAEKKAWIQAHPEKVSQRAIGEKQDPNVRSNERFASDTEKKAWIQANLEEYRASMNASPKTESNERFSSDADKQAWLEAGGNTELQRAWSKFKPTNKVLSTEKYASDAEKEAALNADKNQ